MVAAHTYHRGRLDVGPTIIVNAPDARRLTRRPLGARTVQFARRQ